MKNFDGIKKSKIAEPNKPRVAYKKTVAVDGLVKRQVKKDPSIIKKIQKPVFITPYKPKAASGRAVFLQKFYKQKQVPVLVAVAALIIAFAAGSWSVLSTSKTAADSRPEVLGAYTGQPPQPNPSRPTGNPVAGGQLQNQDGANVDNNILFNTPIEYLQNYLAAINQPEVINRRKNQLQQFLNDRHSPLAAAAETIAQQSHWKLILAIAFAESTLGKNCADFNCSNIGIKPGNPIWHKYAGYDAWVLDFNKLLDRRYKDQTLTQMCGVYVKPCNPNWLLATQQILDALNEQGIE